MNVFPKPALCCVRSPTRWAGGICLALALAALGGLGAGCVPSKKKASKPAESALWQPRLGKVVLVNAPASGPEGSGFVLLDIGTAPAPSSGTRLACYGGSHPTAELAVSSYQKRPYLIADILSGAPQVGNSVVIQKAQTEKAPAPSAPVRPLSEPLLQESGEPPVSSPAPIRGNSIGLGAEGGVPARPRPFVPDPVTSETRFLPNPAPALEAGAEDGIIPGLPTPRRKQSQPSAAGSAETP